MFFENFQKNFKLAPCFVFNVVCSALCFFLFACTDSSSNVDDKYTGGVTDIGNSVASTKISGIVKNSEGVGVSQARVVAYYDNWNQISAVDSVEVLSDSNGIFTMVVDSMHEVVLYAEYEGSCGLAQVDMDDENTLVIGSPKRLESSISGESSGYMRIVGTNEIAQISKEGSFAFDSVPPGDISLVYVRDDQPFGHLDFKTVDDRDEIALPPLENRNDDGRFSSPYFNGSMFGVEFGYRENNHDTALINMDLHMEGRERVFNYDMTVAKDVDYVDGFSGKAILLKQGQFIDLGSVNLTKGDFTLSLWTKWNGMNDGRQILFSLHDVENGDSVWREWFLDGKRLVASNGKSDRIEFGYSLEIPAGQWSFLTIVSKNGAVSMYVNGRGLAVNKSNGKEFSAFVNWDKKIEGGMLRVGGNGKETWNGPIDEVHVENVAQSADWVKMVYQFAGKNQNSLR